MSQSPRNPYPTVDVIIELERPSRPIVLVQRVNPPHGWALPGGFVDYGESLEAAARREAAEETGLAVELVAVLGAYSGPGRDPRQHNLSVVFVGRAKGEPRGGSDAAQARAFLPEDLPGPLCFDHGLIISHYLLWRTGLRPAAPVQ
ncbi:MAG: NUDIX hydrolase [Proteobacteria bacterium]|nr:NUDIX hydrolase [Pseudomonadota bacterium]